MEVDIETQLMAQGIEERNQGNFDLALELFNRAKNVAPMDLRVYENIYKVHFFMRDFKAAFQNLMVVCHSEILGDPYINHPLGQAITMQEIEFFKAIQIPLFGNYVLESELIIDSVGLNNSLMNLFFMGNSITYRIGHSYVGLHLNTNILSGYGNRNELFDNYHYRITDRNKGDSFFNIGEKKFFVCTGFIFANMNLKTDLKTKEEIISHYLNPTLEIRLDLWNFRQFLTNSASA